jgi:hypothetical protein
MGRSAVVVSLAFAAAVLLSGCTPSTPSAGHSGTVSSSGSATPSDAGTPAAAAFTLPADCTAIASSATLTALFADIPSRTPGDLQNRPAPASATKKLTCSWFAGDTTGGDVIYYSAPAAADQAYLAVMQANGFTCTAALGGTRCDKTTPNTQYPVDTVETTFTRDDVWIYLSMTNVDATPLLPDLVETAWAA